MVCTSAECGSSYPIVDGVPVLIHEPRSLFRIDEIVASRSEPAAHSSSWRTKLVDSLPGISRNLKAPQNLRQLHAELKKRPGRPRVLVIGGGILGYGLEPIAEDTSIDMVETDVFFGPRAAMICDAHDIPFADMSFDAVVMQGVLGALIDPVRASEEIHRVLKADGLVYVEVPFVQQVCMGRYDFQRYTHVGLRRVFRRFEEITSGAQGGPGMALAWGYQYFLWSLARSRGARRLMLVVARCTAWWLKYVDRFVIDNPGGIDAAAGVFFLGRRAERVVSDHEVIAGYRGAFR